MGEKADPSASRAHVAPAALPIAVFVHVHYLDVWTEIAERLSKTLRTPFRLFLTTTHATADLVLPQTPFLVSAKVYRTENRGRDIRPFLLALRDADPFEIGLKLHTKRSEHRLDGAEWRAIILSSLLSPPGGTCALVEKFAADDRIAMVAPDSSFLALRPWVMRNRATMAALSASIGRRFERADLDEAFFAAGTMFWFKRDVLSGFADGRLDACFEEERGQVDGTAAHAIERLFGLETKRLGRHVLDVSGLMASSPDMPERALADLADKGCLRSAAYFVRPPALVRWAALYFTPALFVYRNLPNGLRQVLKAALSGRPDRR